jgi:hypothetical protein
VHRPSRNDDRDHLHRELHLQLCREVAAPQILPQPGLIRANVFVFSIWQNKFLKECLNIANKSELHLHRELDLQLCVAPAAAR